MDFSNLAREFLDGLDGVLLARNHQHSTRVVVDSAEDHPVDQRRRAAAHHHCPSSISLDSSLDTTQKTTNSDSEEEEEQPRCVPPGVGSRQRTATTFGQNLQPTVEHQRFPIPPRHLARSYPLQLDPSKRVIINKQSPPPTTPPPSVREVSNTRANSVVVAPPPTHPRPPRQARSGGQGLPNHRRSAHSLSESQVSSRTKEPTIQCSGPANIMCHLTELSLDVCFGGDTQAATAVAGVEPQPEEPQRNEAPVAADDDDTVPDKEMGHDRKDGARKHLSCFGHGKFWTCFAILFAWMGVLLAILSRRSTEFVHLVTGFDVSPQYEPLHNFGMLYVELCFNATMMHDSSCQILRLSTDDVDDNLFNVSRALLGLATSLGGVLAVMISTSIFWESINLKPIGIGFLVTYLFQSFSLLFFDTDLCNDFTCRMGSGGMLCIVASFCWLAACVGTAKMEIFKLRTIRARRRNARRLAKADRKAQKLRRQKDLERITTISTTSSSRDEEESSPKPATGRVGRSMAL